MKLKQAAIEPYYFEQWRVAVGDGRFGLRLPGEKVLERTERGAGGIEFVGVFRGDQAAFAGRGKLDRVAGDDVPHGWPVGSGHRALLKDHRPFANRHTLEGGSFRSALAADRRSEPLSDLTDDRGQIPFADRSQVSVVRGTGRPLLETPAVLHEKAPGPVGLNRLQHTAGFRRGLVDGGVKQDQSLRIIRCPVARLGEDSRGDRPGHLGPGPIGECSLFNPLERRGGRLWLPFLNRLVDGLPGGRPWSAGSIVTTGVVHGHPDTSGEESSEREKHGADAERGADDSSKADACNAHGTTLRNGERNSSPPQQSTG